MVKSAGFIVYAVAVWLLAAATAVVHAAEPAGSTYPGVAWEPVASVQAAGYSPSKLAAVRRKLESIDTQSMLVVVNGRVLFEYGDTARLSYLASARKSVLTMLYGRYVANATIRLDRTLADIGFDDLQGLTQNERRATIANILTARSGIYHPASNPGDDTAHAPPRDSVAPGSKHLYNNWDFNAAGAIFEQLTGRDIYDALDTDLARPIGMQDFDRGRQRKSGNLARSRYPAYHLWLSARDMARLGLLMLRDGRWNGVEVMPPGWAGRIAALVTPHDELIHDRKRRIAAAGESWGYGYMWWVWDTRRDTDVMAGAYSARGLGGQFITVIPRLDMVITHKTESPQPDLPAGSTRKQVTGTQYAEVVRMVIAAHCRETRCD